MKAPEQVRKTITVLQSKITYAHGFGRNVGGGASGQREIYVTKVLDQAVCMQKKKLKQS